MQLTNGGFGWQSSAGALTTLDLLVHRLGHVLSNLVEVVHPQWQCISMVMGQNWGTSEESQKHWLVLLICLFCGWYIIPLVPHKAAAEVSKIGNLEERLVVVNHGWQGESLMDRQVVEVSSLSLSFSESVVLHPAHPSLSLFFYFSDYLPTYLSFYLSTYLSIYLAIYLSI